MDADKKSVRLAHMKEVQGVRLPDEESDEVLGIAEGFIRSYHRVAERLPFDSEPAGFRRVMGELVKKS